jgi:hypothetical protein
MGVRQLELQPVAAALSTAAGPQSLGQGLSLQLRITGATAALSLCTPRAERRKILRSTSEPLDHGHSVAPTKTHTLPSAALLLAFWPCQQSVPFLDLI